MLSSWMRKDLKAFPIFRRLWRLFSILDRIFKIYLEDYSFLPFSSWNISAICQSVIYSTEERKTHFLMLHLTILDVGRLDLTMLDVGCLDLTILDVGCLDGTHLTEMRKEQQLNLSFSTSFSHTLLKIEFIPTHFSTEFYWVLKLSFELWENETGRECFLWYSFIVLSIEKQLEMSDIFVTTSDWTSPVVKVETHSKVMSSWLTVTERVKGKEP